MGDYFYARVPTVGGAGRKQCELPLSHARQRPEISAGACAEEKNRLNYAPLLNTTTEQATTCTAATRRHAAARVSGHVSAQATGPTTTNNGRNADDGLRQRKCGRGNVGNVNQHQSTFEPRQHNERIE